MSWEQGPGHLGSGALPQRRSAGRGRDSPGLVWPASCRFQEQNGGKMQVRWVGGDVMECSVQEVDGLGSVGKQWAICRATGGAERNRCHALTRLWMGRLFRVTVTFSPRVFTCISRAPHCTCSPPIPVRFTEESRKQYLPIMDRIKEVRRLQTPIGSSTAQQGACPLNPHHRASIFPPGSRLTPHTENELAPHRGGRACRGE